MTQYLFEIGNSNGKALYANNNVEYVKITSIPTDKFGLIVKLDGTEEQLLDAVYRNINEATWDAVRIAANRHSNKPAEIQYFFNSCKLDKLTYDIEEGVVLWKDELADMDAIVHELTVKLTDGTASDGL